MAYKALPLAVFAAALVLIAAATALGRGATGVSALNNCETAGAGVNAAEQQMLELMNQARAAEGLGPLAFSPNLNRAAAWKSEDAQGRALSHSDSTGRAWDQRIRDCGYPAPLAENVGFGSSDARIMHNAFMQSPGHRGNILHPRARFVGIGQFSTNWTIDFGNYDDSGDPQPTTAPTNTPTTSGPTRTPTSTPTATPTATPTKPALPPGRAVAPMLAAGAN